jgi:hypothetical protein
VVDLFVDIGGIVDGHFLNFLFHNQYTVKPDETGH